MPVARIWEISQRESGISAGRVIELLKRHRLISAEGDEEGQ